MANIIAWAITITCLTLVPISLAGFVVLCILDLVGGVWPKRWSLTGNE
jgi:hypothetical protein